MYAPDEVAEAILHAAEHPVRDLLIGDIAPLQSAMGKYAPRLGDKYLEATMFEGQKDTRTPLPGEHQILERSSGELRERGGYGTAVMERSVYTRAAMHPVMSATIAIGAGLAAAMLFRRPPGR